MNLLISVVSLFPEFKVIWALYQRQNPQLLPFYKTKFDFGPKNSDENFTFVLNKFFDLLVSFRKV